MKRLRISKLMDEYTDTEFFPTGGTTVNPEAVKGCVLANAKPARQTRLAPNKKKVLLAAALVAVLVLLVGAGFPYMEHRLASGSLIFEQKPDGMITAMVHYGPVMDLEDDRIYFMPEKEQRIDVTDLINEDTPYIYDGSDPETGSSYYIILGGTPGNYGYLEWITTPDPFDYGDGHPFVQAFDESGRRIQVNYAFTWWVTCDAGERHHYGLHSNVNVVQMEDFMKRPWLLDGLTQLGIPFEDTLESSDISSYLLP